MRIKYLFVLYHIMILVLLLVIIFEIFIKKKYSPDLPAPQKYIVTQSATSTNLLQSDQSGNMSIMNLDNIVLVGQISYFAFNFLASDPDPPPRYLICDGLAVSRTTYSNLFNVIGITFGPGNGTSTFNIPDLRGMFIRGYDPTGNVDGGRTFGTTQQDTIQNITGRAQGMYYSNYPYAAGAMAGSNSNVGSNQTVGTGNSNGQGGSVEFDASRVVRTSTETRPKNVALLACIRF
jgi:microcystin-dependent protein